MPKVLSRLFTLASLPKLASRVLERADGIWLPQLEATFFFRAYAQPCCLRSTWRAILGCQIRDLARRVFHGVSCLPMLSMLPSINKENQFASCQRHKQEATQKYFNTHSSRPAAKKKEKNILSCMRTVDFSSCVEASTTESVIP